MKRRWLIGMAVGFLAVSVEVANAQSAAVYACVNESSGEVRIVTEDTACVGNRTLVQLAGAGARTERMTFNIDCDAGDKIGLPPTIGGVTIELIPRDTLLVSGTCNENVVIREELNRITLDGQGTATVNGPNATLDTIEVRGRGINIKSFNVTGGRDGIRVFRGGTATNIDGNSIQSTGRNGISVNRNSSASIANNTIQSVGVGIGLGDSSAASISNNTLQNLSDDAIQIFGGSVANIGREGPNIIQNSKDGIRVNASSATIVGNTITGVTANGIQVTENSSVRIGFSSLSDTQPTPNTIQGNRRGIRVISSEALIAGNDISNNTINGIQVERTSHAAIASNTINGNGDGINVSENSGVNLASIGATGAFFSAANTGENAGVGVKCSIGGYVRGSLGTLDGGAVAFDGTCIDVLSP